MKKSALLLAMVLGLWLNSVGQQKNQYVKLETPQGWCIIKLYNQTPKHRDNFIRLVKSHYFNATTFNRILKGFVIQGGDPDSLYDKEHKLNPAQRWIAPEFADSLYHKRGAVAMGRDANPSESSFTTQFYIVDGKTYTNPQLDSLELKLQVHFTTSQREAYSTIGGIPRLDHHYTVFGEIVKGADLIDKINTVKVDKAGNPDTPVWMKVTLLTAKQAMNLK